MGWERFYQIIKTWEFILCSGYFTKVIKHTFRLVHVINISYVGRTLEKVENHEPISRVLPTSRVLITENRDMITV